MGRLSGWDLIPVDGQPIRDKAHQEYQQVLSDLERARQDLEQFETHDQPAFLRWLNRHFGALITQIREMSQKLQTQRDLLFEIESEALLTGSSHARAYERVMWRKEHPDEQHADPDEPGGHAHNGQAEPGSFEEAFESFFADMDEAFRDAAGFAPGNGAPPPTPKSGKHVSARLKELYRALVRRLHPDKHGTMTPQRRERWHQVQAAYQSGDTEQLQVILSLCEIEDQGTTASASVSLLTQITRQLKSSLRTLKAQLNKCRLDPAWKFSVLRNSGSLAAKTERQLKSELSELTSALAVVDSQLQNWAKQAEAAKRRSSGRRRAKPRPEFLF